MARDYGGTATRITGVGDEAWFLDWSSQEVWVRQGEHVLFVWLTGGLDLDGARQAASDMLTRITPGMLEHPIQVPAECPAPTSGRITSATGKVVRAVGATSAKGTMCTYAGTNRQLTLSTSRWKPAKLRKRMAVDSAFRSDQARTSTIVPQSTTVLEPVDEGPFAATYVMKPSAVVFASLDVVQHLVGPDLKTSYDQDAFARLNRWWVKTQVAELRG